MLILGDAHQLLKTNRVKVLVRGRDLIKNPTVRKMHVLPDESETTKTDRSFMNVSVMQRIRAGNAMADIEG